MADVWRLLKRNPRVGLAEFQAQPVVHDVVHHPQRGRGDAGRELADLDAVELIDIDHREHVRERLKLPRAAARCQLPQHLDFQRAQLAVGDDEEVATAARRIEQAQRAELLLEPPEIGDAAARLQPLKLGPQVVEEQRLDHLQDVLLGRVVPHPGRGDRPAP